MISKAARDLVFTRLRDNWASAVDACTGYDDVSPADRDRIRGIAWSGPRQQVFRGQVLVESLENSTSVRWPLVVIYTTDLDHNGAEKFIMFSGEVAVNVEFHMTWRKSAALPNFDESLDLIEEAFVRVMHDKTWMGALGSIYYSGKLTAQRGALQESGENWAQTSNFRLLIGVDA